MRRLYALGTCVALGASACATQQAGTHPAGLVQRPVGAVDTDADALFEQARAATQDDDTTRAEALYLEVIAMRAEDPLAPLARYNLGLLYERRSAWTDAVTQYAAIVALRPEVPGRRRDTWRDAHYRLAACAAKVGDWSTAGGTLLAVLDEPDLEDVDRLEAMVGAGVALSESGSDEAARLMLGDAVRFVRTRQREGRFEDRGFGAEAAFRLAELANADYAVATLTMPEAQLAPLLEEKCRRLLVAQQHYVEAIAMGDAHTAAAAGFRVGALYETLYEALAALAPPGDLDDEQTSVYRDLVAERLGVLLHKARHVYTRALAVGSQASTAAPWLDRLRLALDRLEALASSLPGQHGQSTAGVLTPAARIAQ